MTKARPALKPGLDLDLRYWLRSPEENRELSVEWARVTAYEAGALDLNEAVLLAQDIYEAGVMPHLSPRFFLLHLHCVRNGLIHVSGRALH